MLRTFAECTTAVFIHNVKCVDPLDFYKALRVEEPGRVILFDTYAGAALGALTAELVDEVGAAAIANAAILEIREVDFSSTAKKTQVRFVTHRLFFPPAHFPNCFVSTSWFIVSPPRAASPAHDCYSSFLLFVISFVLVHRPPRTTARARRWIPRWAPTDRRGRYR